MIVPISHAMWQQLRFALRAELSSEPFPLGRELRLVPSRNTKDGTFLDDLVEMGLLEVAAKPAPLSASATSAERRAPVQFRTRYRLTDLGRHAAEYGEYDQRYEPTPQPVTGTAAEILASLPSPHRKGKPGGTTKRTPRGGQFV